jgi:hypothetical protein
MPLINSYTPSPGYAVVDDILVAVRSGAMVNIKLGSLAGQSSAISATSTVSSLVQRDANQNIFSNNYFSNTNSVTSAGATTILTAANGRDQILTGSSSQTYQLPDATTLSVSSIFNFNNNSSGSLIIVNAGSSAQYTVPAGGYVECKLTNNGSVNGVWDFHPIPPLTVTWGSGTTGFVMNTALTTSPSVSAGISSATAPSFIPQRGSATTGYGGDSTHLYGIVGGVNVLTASTVGLSVPTDNALTAAGTTRADALQLVKQINNITTAAASTGVILPVGVIGMRIVIFNNGANAIKVYASASETVDGTAGSSGVTLTNAKRCEYFFVAANTWISAQLGVVSA